MFYRDKDRLPRVKCAGWLVRICSKRVAETKPVRSATMFTHAPTMISTGYVVHVIHHE